MSVTVSGSNPLTTYFDPTGALAQSKVDFSLRMEQASQAPTEALASFLTHHGFSDAPQVAEALWAMAQRGNQTWASGNIGDATGPARLSWAIDSKNLRSPLAAFGRLCLRAQNLLMGDASNQSKKPENPLWAYTHALHLIADDLPEPGATPASLALAFMRMSKSAQWDRAREVAQRPGFDWFGMVLKGPEGFPWDGFFPSVQVGPLDGAVSPAQYFVAQCARAGALLGPGPKNTDPIHETVNADRQDLIDSLWSLAQRAALAQEIGLSGPSGAKGRLGVLASPLGQNSEAAVAPSVRRGRRI